jgi:catechol 2,3-dioxygenase-like lactoylglutathione lyase family enzyme
MWGEFREGLQYLLKNRALNALSIVRLFFYFLYGPYEVVLPLMANTTFGGAKALGILWSVLWFQCGNHQVHIGVQKGFVPATKAHPAFHVENIDELREYLIRKGVKVIDDDARADEGIKRFYLNDPFGNRLEFLEWR